MKRIAGAAVLALCAAGVARAEGCPPPDGVTIGRVEVLNQLVLNNNFAGLAIEFEKDTGVNIRAQIMSIADLYKDGFDGCTTILQRKDIGGMVQTVVMYHGKVGPLFGYYATMDDGGTARVLLFNLNSTFDDAINKLR